MATDSSQLRGWLLKDVLDLGSPKGMSKVKALKYVALRARVLKRDEMGDFSLDPNFLPSISQIILDNKSALEIALWVKPKTSICTIR